MAVTLAFAGSPAGSSPARRASATPPARRRHCPADELSQQLSLARSVLGSGRLRHRVPGLPACPRAGPGQRRGDHLPRLGGRAHRAPAAAGADLVDLGVAQLRQAISLDTTYTDAHCLLGVALVRFVAAPEPAEGRAELTTCLANDPPQEVRALVEPVLASLDAHVDG